MAVVVVSTARQQALTLENALVRKHARRFARQEKEIQAAKREMEALARIQHRREQWQFLQERTPKNPQNTVLLRCLDIGKGIVDIQQTLELLIKTQSLSAGASPGGPGSPPKAFPRVTSDGYGSDSDFSVSRCGSLLGQCKARHTSDFRGVLDTLNPETLDLDLRKLFGSGEALPMSPPLEERSWSEAAVSRALAHVEQLQTCSPSAVAQYVGVKQAAREWLEAERPEEGSKYARIDLTASRKGQC